MASKTYTLALLALLGIAGVSRAQFCFNADVDAVVGEYINEHCACDSGFTGNTDNQCDVSTVDAFGSDACLPFPAPEQLATQRPASMDTADTPDSGTYVAADTLHMRLRSPFTDGRRVTAIDIADSGNAACMYPGAGWSHALGESDCADHYDAAIDFAVATSSAADGGCGFVRTADDDYYYYDAAIDVEVTEDAGSVGGEAIVRTIDSQFRLQVQLPREVTVTYNTLNVFNPAGVDLEAAITEQRFDSPPVDQGTVVYRTAVPWPYRIDGDDLSEALTAVPAGLVGELVESGDPALCPDADATAEDFDAPLCIQEFTLTINRTDPATCELDGAYNFAMPIECRGDAELCPLEGGETVTIESSLDSEDVCATIVLQYDLDATIGAFGDEAWTEPKNTFIDADTVFMRVGALSDEVSLETTSVVAVEYGGALDAANALAPLYASGAPTAVAAANAFALLAGGADTAGFRFDVSVGEGADDLFAVDENGFAIFQLRVTVAVTYIDGAARRRSEQVTFERVFHHRRQSDGLPAGSAVAVEEIVVSAGSVGGDNNDDVAVGVGGGSNGGAGVPVVAIIGAVGGVIGIAGVTACAVLAAGGRRRRNKDDEKAAEAAVDIELAGAAALRDDGGESSGIDDM